MLGPIALITSTLLGIDAGWQPRPEGGVLSVYGRSENDRVVITIGNPLAPEGTQTRGHGMAIRNIRERLALAWGNRADLFTNRDNERFYAVMVVPYVERTDR